MDFQKEAHRQGRQKKSQGFIIKEVSERKKKYWRKQHIFKNKKKSHK